MECEPVTSCPFYPSTYLPSTFPLSEKGSASYLLKSTPQLGALIPPSLFYDFAFVSPARFGSKAESSTMSALETVIGSSECGYCELVPQDLCCVLDTKPAT